LNGKKFEVPKKKSQDLLASGLVMASQTNKKTSCSQMSRMPVPPNGVEYNTNVVNWSGLSATTLLHLAFAFSAQGTGFLSDTTRTEAQVQHETFNYINLIVKIGNRAECLSRQLKSESGGGAAATSEAGVVEITCEQRLKASDSTGAVEFVAWKNGSIRVLVEAKNAVLDRKSVVGQLFAETKGGRAFNESNEFFSVIVDGSGNMDFFEQRLPSSSEIQDGYTEDFKLVGLGRGQLFFHAKETMSTMTSLKCIDKMYLILFPNHVDNFFQKHVQSSVVELMSGHLTENFLLGCVLSIFSDEKHRSEMSAWITETNQHHKADIGIDGAFRNVANKLTEVTEENLQTHINSAFAEQGAVITEQGAVIAGLVAENAEQGTVIAGLVAENAELRGGACAAVRKRGRLD
jgi:hypothetical protein